MSSIACRAGAGARCVRTRRDVHRHGVALVGRSGSAVQLVASGARVVATPIVEGMRHAGQSLTDEGEACRSTPLRPVSKLSNYSAEQLTWIFPELNGVASSARTSTVAELLTLPDTRSTIVQEPCSRIPPLLPRDRRSSTNACVCLKRTEGSHPVSHSSFCLQDLDGGTMGKLCYLA